ncbi:MAG: hypothetical protein ABH851_08400 [Methanobacteriota archaeon]
MTHKPARGRILRVGSPKDYQDQIKDKVFVYPGKVLDTDVTFTGICHGYTNVRQMDLQAKQILAEELKREENLVLTEVDLDPFDYPAETVKIDKSGKVVVTTVLSGIPQTAAEVIILGQQVLGLVREQAAEAEEARPETARDITRIEGLPPSMRFDARTIHEEPLMKAFMELDYPPDEIINGMLFIERIRSLLMAAEIRKNLKERNPKTATTVQGINHMSDTYNFATNPELGRRYCGRVITSLLEETRKEDKPADWASTFMGFTLASVQMAKKKF